MSKQNRRGRKDASDSEAALLAEQRKADLSVATAPTDTPGYQVLGEVGRGYFTQFYRCRHDWTTADLVLICRAARAQELILLLELQAMGQPALMPNGKANPIFAMIDAQVRIVQTHLRDAGLRNRDSAPESEAGRHGVCNTPHRPASSASTTGTSTGFDDWMGSNELH